MSRNPPIPDLSQILDELLIPDHGCLDFDDECRFIWERQPGVGRYDVPVNQLIANLQKDIVKYPPGSQPHFYKTQAIDYAARALDKLVDDDWVEDCVWVPVPPSGGLDTPEHDNRLMQVLKKFSTKRDGAVDVQELVVQLDTTESKRKNVSPAERASKWSMNGLCDWPGDPTAIVVFDDVIAGGSHFKAMQMLLQEIYQSVEVRGFFLARQVRDDFQ